MTHWGIREDWVTGPTGLWEIRRRTLRGQDEIKVSSFSIQCLTTNNTGIIIIIIICDIIILIMTEK